MTSPRTKKARYAAIESAAGLVSGSFSALKYGFPAIVISLLAITLSLGRIYSSQPQQTAEQTTPADLKASLSASLPRPLYFIRNEGEQNPAVAYYTVHGAQKVFATNTGLYYQAAAEQEGTQGTWTTAVEFDGARLVDPVATQEGSARLSFFQGSPDEWRTGVPTISELRYSNLWDGIDLLVSTDTGAVKYEFVVAPGANPDQIKLRYSGAELALRDGNLVARSPAGALVDNAPVSFQEFGGDQRLVDSRFALDGSTVSFALGEYDPTQPLIIDPIVITYASYLGGVDYEDNGEIQIDSSGNIYTGGVSSATDTFTGEPGFDTTYGGGSTDGYVVKYAPDGTDLLWGTYIGGTDDDSLFGMVIDDAGDVYATGTTLSTSSFQVPDEGFPATAGAYDTTLETTFVKQDAFVCKIDTDGLSLHYCTYLGGTDGEFSFDIATDSLGRAYITGQVNSSEAEGFPVTIGPDLTFNGTAAEGDHDVFVARFSADGSALEYAGYIGGSGGTSALFRAESADGIVVDSLFNAYVSGNTPSTEATFPDGDGFGLVPGYDQTHAGGLDGFVAAISPTGATLTGATYIGGSADDKQRVNDLAADGDLIVLGETFSTEATGYPVTGGVDGTHNGGLDATILKIDTALTTPSLSGFYGGSGDDFSGESCNSIISDADSNMYITGWTESTETSFPVLDGPDMTYNGDVFDGFIAKFTDTGTLVYSGYIGGEGDDYACGIALDSSGAAWTTVTTPSATTFPNGYGFYSIPGFDQTFGGSYDGSIVRVSEVPAAITVVESGGSTDIDETGPTSDDYTVVLTSQPQFEVTVTIGPNAQQTTDEASLTFTPLDWDVPQPVIVTAVADGIPECPHTGLILHTASSADLNYDGISVASVVPNITDVGCDDPAVIVTESGGSTDINEVGPSSDDYTVVLTSQPSANVSVGIFPNQQQTTDLSTLTFTPSNWNIPQEVVTTAVQDGVVECLHTGLIQHTAASSDPDYDGIAVASVVPNINDNCKRLPGSDPTTQSIQVSRHRFPTDHSAPAAILARNELMVDAFTGVPFASVRPAPLLLTPPDQLDSGVADELHRVLTSVDDPIYILGREEAVTPVVYDQLRASGFTNLIQVGGEHRRETAAKIALQIISKQGTATRAIITEDERLVDALGAGAAAGLLGVDSLVDPILLNARGSNKIDVYTDAVLSAHPTITALELIGGDAALPLELNQTFTKRYPHLLSLERTGGDDRFTTNAMIAERFFPNPKGVVVANGERHAIPGALTAASGSAETHFAALLAGTIAADEGYPLLIVRTNSVPAPIITFLIQNEPTIDSLIIVGDLSQVTQAVEDLIKSFI